MSEIPIFSQNVIAIVWDFDKTLIASYMQEPLFKKFGIQGKAFWDEVNELEAYYAKQNIRVNKDTIYLNHLITYTQQGIFPGLNNQMLTEFGKELEFYPGLPEFFPDLKQKVQENARYREFDIRLEHYIVSTGLAAMIRGSAIAPYIDGLWGCEFIEQPALPHLAEPDKKSEPMITQIGYAVDNTSKTRALFEINKGSNKYPEIDVNAKVVEKDRRIPFKHMIYIADGPSDVPAFSIVKKFGGHTYAVYPSGNEAALSQVDALREDGRIDVYGEANYAAGSQTYLWLLARVRKIADSMVQSKKNAIKSAISTVPKHLV